MHGSVRIGRIGGIAIEVHFTWFIVFGLVALSLIASFADHAPPMAVVPVAVITALLFFASVLAHELAHSFVANRYDRLVERITLFVFGGIAHLKKEPPSSKVEFLVALAGPAMSIALAAVFGGLYFALGGLGVPWWLLQGLMYLAVMNAILAVFNMLPAFPLDGGRVLRAAVWWSTGRFEDATRVAAGIGQVAGYVFMGIGFFLMFSGRLINGLWLMAIGWMLLQAAQSSVQRIVLARALQGVRMADIMTSPVVTVSPDWPVGHVVYEVFIRRSLREVPVVGLTGPVGMIDITDVQHVPQEHWPYVPVSQVMREFNPECVVAPEDDATKALFCMASGGHGRMFVADPAGRLIGVVGHRDVMQAVQIGLMLARGRQPGSEVGYRYPLPPPPPQTPPDRGF